jgi:2'-5' RNA ligase
MKIDEQEHDYATTQAIPPEDVIQAVLAARQEIDQEDLNAEEGFGDDPHVTVLYGLSDDQREPALEILRGAGDLDATVKGVDVFQNDDYDVVIFALESESLSALRDKLDQLPNANEWPDYRPHMTVAYVQKGLGEKYKKSLQSDIINARFKIDKLEFSGADGDVATVDLSSGSPNLDDSSVTEETPLFGTDLLEGPELGERVEAALQPVLNRSNRRLANVVEDESGVHVILDNGFSFDMSQVTEDEWVAEHRGSTYSTKSPTDIESLVKIVNNDITEQRRGGIFPVGKKPTPPVMPQTMDPYPVDMPPAEPPARPKQPMPKVRQNPAVEVSRGNRGVVGIRVKQPVGYDAKGNRFDRTDQVTALLKNQFGDSGTVRQTTVNTIEFNPSNPRMDNTDAIANLLRSKKYDVPKIAAPAQKPGLMRRAAGAIGRGIKTAGGLILSDDVSEDTYTSDVAITDYVPITSTSRRRRKVKRPGLRDSAGSGVRRLVTRRYDVNESMSRGNNPVLLVITPNKLTALASKPVWSALRESGVIEAKPFKMGENEFVEVRIDTLRREWTDANAEVLLDEVGSVDPIAQRKIMESVAVEKVASYVAAKLPELCRSVPVAEALLESAEFVKAHREHRLAGNIPDEAWVQGRLEKDCEIGSKILEWFHLSKPVLDALKQIDNRFVAQSAARILEDETTDPSAGIGAPGSGPMSGNPAGGVTQGYSEQEPEGVEVSSRTWQPGDLFKLYVLVGESPRWVYREVIGHEGEGNASVLVYRSDDGRVMQLPHDQIDQAVGFEAVVSPDQMGAVEPAAPAPGDATPPDIAAQSPEGQLPAPPSIPVESVDEDYGMIAGRTTPAGAGGVGGENIESDLLRKNNDFAQALVQYQASKDPRDWEETRKRAERITGKTGPELDTVLSVFSADSAQEDVLVKPDGTKITESVLVDDEEEGDRQAYRAFTDDREFNKMLDNYRLTRNEGFVDKASERAARVAGMPTARARRLVDELVKAESAR